MTTIAASASVQRHDHPYRWLLLEPALEAGAVDRLADEFPGGDLADARSAAAHYELRDLTVVEAGRLTEAGRALSAAWREHLTALSADAHRDQMAALTGVDLRGCRLKVRLCEYGPDAYMTAHTDKPDRVVTQIVYLNRVWSPNWGGQLDILATPDDDDPAAVVARVSPRFNTSVIFVRADHSYHVVRRVSTHAAAPRRTILAQFIAGGA